MELLLLGPFEARHGDEAASLGRRLERCVLGVLAVDPDRPMTVDQLIDLLWEGHGALPSRGAIHTSIARLRAALKPFDITIINSNAGYAIGGTLSTDVQRFTEFADEGDAADDAADRAERYGAALALWRGELLADVIEWHVRERLSPQLDERRLRCVEGRAEALIQVGRTGDVISEVAQVAAAHPQRERLIALLMSAYHLQHRQAEALSLYHVVRTYLAEEFGVDPGPELQSRYAAILNGDTAPVAIVADDARTKQLDMLPRSVAGFVGRADHLATLDRIAAGADSTSPIAIISALTGSAGVGKTALAVHWAQQGGTNSFDLRLYIDLQGYGPSEPLMPLDALTYLLRELGVEPGSLPDDVITAAARFRAVIAGSRALVILDNAGSVEQVRPLLPPGAGCLTVVTSRDRLAGLVAIDGAQRVPIDVMTIDEATALLVAMVGADRAGAEPEAIRGLAEVCGRLPLALRIAAAALADEPEQSVAEHVARLSSTDRLSHLDIDGDARNGVRTVFGYSYERVPEPVRRMFRLTGISPGLDIGVEAAAALAGCEPDTAGALLDRLCAAHLMSEHADGRYRMHDLLRDYARDVATGAERPDADQAADRLLGWFCQQAGAVDAILSPARAPLTWIDRTLPARDFGDIATAFAWMEREGPAMIAAAREAEHSHPQRCWQLVVTMAAWLQRQRSSREFMDVTSMAVRAVADSGDAVSQVLTRTAFAIALIYAGRPADALPHFEGALLASRATGETRRILTALQNVGGVLSEVGRLEEAAARLQEALDIIEAEPGMEHMISRVLVNLGHTQRDPAVSISYFERSVPAALRHGDEVDVATCSISLSAQLIGIGRYAEASEAATLAREYADRSGHRLLQARAHDNLGRIAWHHDRTDEAREHIAQAIAGYAEVQPAAIAGMHELAAELGLTVPS